VSFYKQKIPPEDLQRIDSIIQLRTYSDEEIAKEFSVCSTDFITKRRVNKFGIIKTNACKSQLHAKEIIKLYKDDGVRINEIAKIVGVSYNAIYDILVKKGLLKKTNLRVTDNQVRKRRLFNYYSWVQYVIHSLMKKSGKAETDIYLFILTKKGESDLLKEAEEVNDIIPEECFYNGQFDD